MGDQKLCIGLFGTCGESRWRESFIAHYETMGIPYFNPQVATGAWHAGLVANENQHFNQDAIILFPVTSETTGQGSLAEIGFSVSSALRHSHDRFFVFMIEDECHDTTSDEQGRKDSVRSRALVKSKLIDFSKNHPNIILTSSFPEMLKISVDLFQWIQQKEKLDSDLSKILNVK